MKTRTIFLLIFSLAILSCVYYFDQKRRVERWTAEVEKARLLSFPAEETDRISVENRFGRFELVRREGGWWIAEPVSEQANKEMVERVLLGALSESNKFGAIPVSEDERARYGLEKDAVRIRVGSGEGQESAELILGGPTPITGENYLLDAAQPGRVYVTQSNLRRAFERPVLDLRDKRPLDFDASQTARIVTSWEDNQLVFDKQGERDWTVKTAEDAAQRRADAYRINQILYLIEKASPLGSEAEAELDPEIPRRAYAETARADATSEPLHRILLSVEEKDQATTGALTAGDGPAGEKPVRLLFYPRRTDAESSPTLAEPPERRWLFTVNERKLLFEAPPALPDLLRMSPREFYDRNVFSFDSDEVCYLQIEWKIATVSSVFSLEREKGGPWRLPSKPDTRVNQDAVALYISYCLGQMMEPEPAPAAGALDAGLEEPLLRVTLADAERARREGFELGNPSAKDSPFYFVWRVGALAESPEKMFLMRPVPSLAAFIKSENDFAERPAVFFNPEDTARVLVYFRSPDGTTTLTLTRSGGDSGAWNASVGDRRAGALPGAPIETFLLAARGIEYVREPEMVSDAIREEYGLAHPALSIHLYDRADLELNALHVGASAGETREPVLVRNGRNQYYFVRPEALGNVGQALEAILARIRIQEGRP